MYNHFIFDIKIEKLTLKKTEELFAKLVKLLDLQVLQKWSYIFENWGFTNFWLLSESHLSAHYRIEDDYLALDIYCCKDLLKFESNIYKILSKFWKINSKQILERKI